MEKYRVEFVLTTDMKIRERITANRGNTIERNSGTDQT